MVVSMTGYGLGTYTGESYDIEIELKSVNHRYRDLAIHMPRYMNFLEEDIKKLIEAKISRGRVDLYLNISYKDESTYDVSLNIPLAREYKKLLDSLKSELDLKSNIEISDITSIPDMLKIERRVKDDELLYKSVKEALDQALNELLDMKLREGESLKEDMELRLNRIIEDILDLEKRAPRIVRDYKLKLENRIEEILDLEVDQYILANEVAMYADKSDVSEEITRLKSHVSQYRDILLEEGVIGRKLDFLIQEMNREINTIGSKSNDVDIVRSVVDIKSEIEKLREQVQNIE